MLLLALLIAILIDRIDDYVDLLVLMYRHFQTPYFNINFFKKSSLNYIKIITYLMY